MNQISDTSYLPLINKYVPKKIKDIILSPLLKSKINRIIETKYIDNTIITGPSGVGKTLLIKLLIKNILGDSYEEGVLDLNTSTQRGLINLTHTLPYFCQKQILKLDNLNIPKIVFMDEADNITKKAQNLISNILEQYSDSTVFIFTCNDSSKIIESIQSRCSILYIPPISSKNIENKLVSICEKELIQYTIEGLSIISKSCKGDLRASINLLDVVCNGFSVVNVHNVTQMLYRPDSFEMIELIQACAEKDIHKCFELLNVLKLKGFCGTDILLALIDILKQVDIEEEIRIKYIDIITRFFCKISDGLDTNLQLYGCLSEMILV